MYHSCRKHTLFIVLFLLIGSAAYSQKSNRENNPYTRFGIGEFRNGVNSALRGMGSISSAYSDDYTINTDNPASYADFKMTLYEASLEGSRSTIFNNGTTTPTGTLTLSYLTIGIPLGKHMGMVLGLRPYTRTYYNTRDSIDMPGLGPSIRGYAGDGSLSYGYAGVAGRYKGFSAGVNLGYLFGTISHASLLARQYDSVNVFNSGFSEFTRVGDFLYKAGVQYETPLTNKIGLRVGATYSGKQNVNAKRDRYEYIYKSYATTGIVSDTSLAMKGAKGSFILPSSFSIGAQVFTDKKWATGFDFTLSNYGQFRNFGMMDSVANNSYRIAVGGEYTPNSVSLYSYLNRITYRIGAYYGKDYIQLRNTDLNYYALTLGASLPFKRSFDRVHLVMELGRRGTSTNGLIKSNFIKFSIGMSLNDRWFIKRKYD
ncbi:MAG: hypothetical protein E6Q89_07035 [Bacteroidia bacterium]|nr:MAG: hypothetical protein E6Q89_07035 [Bacteroidia bacterium]